MIKNIKTFILRKLILLLPAKQFNSLQFLTQNLNGFGYTSHELETNYFKDAFFLISSEPMHVGDIGANYGLWTKKLINQFDKNFVDSPPLFFRDFSRNPD